MAAKSKKKREEYYILLGFTEPRAVFDTVEDLVDFGEAHPHPFDGEVLRYVKGDSATTKVGSYSTVRSRVLAAESLDA